MTFFTNLSPILESLLAGLFTWSVTALGASVVFFFKAIKKNIMDALLGFSAGVMIAASFFSLIEPAIEIAKEIKQNIWFILALGFITGGALLFLFDKLFEIYYQKKNIRTSSAKKRTMALVLSIVIHNIPEGAIVGVAFASASYHIKGASIAAALVLALGIGIQNFPEGSAISLPLRREGYSRKKAFFYGQLSGFVEPIAAVIGALLSLRIKIILPFVLAFAAGAMIYVVVVELIPESQTNPKKDLMALFTLFGFAVMMILDIALG